MGTKQSDRLTLSTKLAFGAGDVFGGGSMIIVGFFYLYFLTDVVLISPALAGFAFLISKAWDAISDPIMGVITDKTRTRFGRRRPYFLLGVVLIFCSFFMMWYPVNFAEEFHRFLYVIAAYLFFSTSYTIVMIPYFALASEITTDYNERTNLTSIRMVFSMLSSLICAVMPLEVVKLFPTEREGYVAMALIFACFFSLPYIATFLFTRERKEFQREPEPFSFKRTFIIPFKTPTFINVLLMYLFAMTTMDIISSVMMYFMKYYIGRPGETNYILGTLLIIQLLFIPVAVKIAKRFGKKRTYTYAALYWMVIMVGSFLITDQSPDPAIYIFAGLVGLGSGTLVIMVYSIMPDVPDVDELYSGKRQEGVYSGLMTFVRKLGSALGIFLVSNLIQLAGFKKPVLQTVDGVETLVQQPQTPEFFMILRLVFAAVPALFLLIALYNAIRYRLTPDTHNRLKAFLEKRRAGESVAIEEENALKALLEK